MLHFKARRIPQFSYGCAVFLQSDIVNFQRQGWRPEEILAGLATVLPKNVFLYVAGVSNVASLGSRFVLQGGTQKNLAVVKAEVDFIRKHYHGEGIPEVVVHPNCCEAGAIGAALEAAENRRSQSASSFPGFEFLDRLNYSIRRDESTRCHFCTNRCLRTFVELSADAGNASESKRVIIATCERGEAEEHRRSKENQQRLVRPASKLAQLRAVGGREGMVASAVLSCRFDIGPGAFCTALRQGRIEDAAIARKSASESPGYSIFMPTRRCFPRTSSTSAFPRETFTTRTFRVRKDTRRRPASRRSIPAFLPKWRSPTFTNCSSIARRNRSTQSFSRCSTCSRPLSNIVWVRMHARPARQRRKL